MINKKQIIISQLKIRQLFKIMNVQNIFVAHNAPHRAIIVSNPSKNYQLYAVDFRNGYLRQVTNRKNGVFLGSISPDGNYIYFLNDESGREYGHFLRIPFQGGRSIDLTPNIPPYFAYSLSSDYRNENICFTASINNINSVFLVQYKDGIFETNKIYSSRYSLSESICSPDGQFVCFVESGRKKNENILSLFSTKKHKRIIRVYFSEMIIPVTFSQNTQFPVLLCLLRVNSWLRPIFYDFKHNKIIKINHKEFSGDTWILSWFEKSNEMILLDIYQAQQRLYLYNYQTKKLQRIGPRTGSFSFNFDSVIHFQKNSKKFLIVKWSDFNNPSCLIRLKPPNYNTWNKIKKFSSKFSSKYKIKNIFTFSSDKKRIQAWIITPKTIKKQLPFVIDLHGGPHGVAMNEFSPEAQVWLRSGFGYCAVNYRGSISFGKDFERKIYGNPGYWEVEDVVAVRNWLVKNKYTDSKNIILYGWSRGGYIVLLALGKYPNLWCCGIAGSAIADWVMQYNDEPAYFKAQDKELFKGTPKTNRICYLRSSPIFYADNIQSPILLLHGKNDVRCPPRQIKYFINKLKKLNKDFCVIWFDSGHIDSFTNIYLRTQLMNKILKFIFKL